MAIWHELSKVIFTGGNRPPVNLNLLEEMLKVVPKEELKDILKRVLKS
jgi:hypothetical protein